MSGDKNEFGQLGKGFLLRILDRTTVMHRGMREFVLDMAETHGIPYQYFVSGGEQMPAEFIFRTAAFHQQLSEFVPAIFIRTLLSFILMIMLQRKKCSSNL